MPKIKRPRSSRRAPPLKDSDYDHEISLVDHGDGESEIDEEYESDDDSGSDSGGDVEESASAATAKEASYASDVNTNNDGANDAVGSRAGTRDAHANADDSDHDTESETSQSPPLIITQSYDPADYPHSTPPVRQVPSGATLASDTASSAALLPSSSQRSATAEPFRVQSQDSNRPSKAASTARLAPQGFLTPYSSARNPEIAPQSSQQGGRSSFQSTRSEAQFAIDILYENERGGFLCGIPLFSGLALGNLDPPNWTNYAHNPSPTNPTTAQVPDPSWEWAWPEWHVNHDNDADEEGWEYSFMFAKCFSWHGPNWYGSFVRRRAWIRKRVKKPANPPPGAGLREVESARDPSLLNPEYFTVLPAGSSRRSTSRASSIRAASISRVGSRGSTGAASQSQASRLGIVGSGGDDEEAVGDDDYDDDGDGFKIPSVIDNTDVLMRVLRTARIDREKIEALDNFLEHSGEDLVRLQDVMHAIMALFVFQASRRALLTRLKKAYRAAVEEKRKAEGVQPGEDTGADGAEAAKDGKAVPASKPTTEEKGKAKAKVEPAPEPNSEPELDLDATTRNGTTPNTVPDTDTPVDLEDVRQALGRRVEYLAAAVQHADEEVRRLEYWSDVKAMAKATVRSLDGPNDPSVA